MTTNHSDPENLETEIVEGAENTVSPVPSPKISRFGPAGFQNGSKFGKGPSGSNNPQLKQRPGRAAARGR